MGPDISCDSYSPIETKLASTPKKKANTCLLIRPASFKAETKVPVCELPYDNIFSYESENSLEDFGISTSTVF